MEESKMSIWKVRTQEIKSSATSINKAQLPATFGSFLKSGISEFIPGTKNADIGGGKYDNATEFLGKIKVKNYIYDPFNRSYDHNVESILSIKNHQCDTVTVNNVLNAIMEKSNRKDVILQARNAVKSAGTVYFLIYEGNKSGIGSKSGKADSWQENRKTQTYVNELEEYFTLKIVKNLIIATPK
jgi:hypothetical protein